MQLQHNATLDRILETNFNLHTADPMYVFLLPAAVADDDRVRPYRTHQPLRHNHQPPPLRLQNRTLVLHRSNFAGPAVYPSISPVQRRLMRTNITRLHTLIENIERIRPHGAAAAAAAVRPRGGAYAPSPTPVGGDLDESESIVAQRVVAENVRTERNFQRFVELLNGSADDHDDDDGDDDDDGTALANRLIDNGDGAAADAVDDASDVNDGYGLNDSDFWRPMLVAGLPIGYGGEYTTGERPAAAAGDRGAGAELSWKDLGLDGWLGGIRKPGRSFHQHAQR